MKIMKIKDTSVFVSYSYGDEVILSKKPKILSDVDIATLLELDVAQVLNTVVVELNENILHPKELHELKNKNKNKDKK